MSKTQYHFNPEIHIFIVSCYSNIHSTRQNKTLPVK